MTEPEEYKKENMQGEELEEAMQKGEAAEDVYTEEGREELTDDDEIAPWEEAFMEGAEGKGAQGTCANCSAVLSQNKADVVEKKFEDKAIYFCSDACAEAYSQKQE